MAAFSLRGSEKEGDLSVMKRAMGIMQHHDAVSGTEKQHVAEDYARLLDEGIAECNKVQSAYYRYVVGCYMRNSRNKARVVPITGVSCH